MPDKIFLEEYPLLKRFNISLPYYLAKFKALPKPPINMYCHECVSVQTYNMYNRYEEHENGEFEQIWGTTVRLCYICSSCQKNIYYFFIEIVKFGDNTQDEDGSVVEHGYMRKVGQNPPWSIKVEKNLEKMLGEHAEFYKRGLTCESQGYGIGAYAYYRRIVETIIDQLLDLIPELLEAEKVEHFKEALKEAKKITIAEDKIALVKDLLPSSLKAGNYNPLGIIHKSLSEGIHALSDEDCLEQAELIRSSLTFLVDEILRKKQNLRVYSESLQKLLDTRFKRHTTANQN